MKCESNEKKNWETHSRIITFRWIYNFAKSMQGVEHGKWQQYTYNYCQNANDGNSNANNNPMKMIIIVVMISLFDWKECFSWILRSSQSLLCLFNGMINICIRWNARNTTFQWLSMMILCINFHAYKNKHTRTYTHGRSIWTCLLVLFFDCVHLTPMFHVFYFIL